MKDNNEKIKIYVWEFPVRLTHWINFFCILTLSLTGFYISSPMDHAIFSKHYLMNWIRFIHFVAAYTFMISFFIRLYWSIAGNEYADMVKWIPLTRKRLKELFNDIRHHLVLDIKATYRIGHTRLGAFMFFILQIIFLFSLVSGFAMYSARHPGESWKVIGEWVQANMPVEGMKGYHKTLMYIFLFFVPSHMFMSWINNVKHKNRLIRSIFSGHKVVDEKHLK